MATTAADKLAIQGGTSVRHGKKWPSWPYFDDTERKAVNEVLDSGKWWYGEKVKEFEQAFATFQDAKFGVTCNSGTAAAELCVQALDVEPGDEVIVPPYTFIATASSVARMGGVPIFVDINESWCMDPDKIEAAITPRTKAIMPVHLGGRIADMDRINEVACKHGLKVIEDACHSWGGKWKGKGTGAIGHGGIFSFQNSKNITAAEGGIIVTDNEEFADAVRSYSNTGRGTDGVWYGHIRVGTNARLTEFQAAILLCQLARLDEQTETRIRNAEYLDRELGQIEGVIPQPGDERITRWARHLYAIRIDPDTFGCSRDKFTEAARGEGIPFGAGYAKPLYEQPALKVGRLASYYKNVHCPMCEDISYRTGMWFPQTLLLGSQEDMRDIVDAVRKIKAHAHELKD